MFENPGDWALENGVRIGIILGLAILLHVIAKRVIPRGVALVMQPQLWEAGRATAEAAHKQRVDTISTVFVRTVDVLIIVVAAFLILAEIGVSLAPLIAGAGVVGLAIGFSAQSLIKDTLAGAFIVLEDQYRTGDVVAIAGVQGTVENITLKRTVLRDLDGIVHSVPNGEIIVSSNLTRGWSGINMIVGVGYGEDFDRIKELVDAVGNELAHDPDWREDIVEAPIVVRVNEFGESSVDLRIVGRTAPHRQWAVAGELRRRLKKCFDAEGVEIPFPHRVLVHQPSGQDETPGT